MKHWNVWNCMDMGSRLGKVHIANLLNMIFLGVSSCCPFSPGNWPLNSQVGPRICCAWRVGSISWMRWNQGKTFSSEWWWPFRQSLFFWMARSGGREPKTWWTSRWLVGKMNILDFIQWIHWLKHLKLGSPKGILGNLFGLMNKTWIESLETLGPWFLEHVPPWSLCFCFWICTQGTADAIQPDTGKMMEHAWTKTLSVNHLQTWYASWYFHMLMLLLL